MEALRSVELTGTNCSIGLIFRNSCVVVNAPRAVEDQKHPRIFLYKSAVFYCCPKLGHSKFFWLCQIILIGFFTLPAFADPVVMAGVPHPIPSRTRPLSPLALMVLRLKARESKSLPGQLKLVMKTDIFPYRLLDWFGPATMADMKNRPCAGFFVSGDLFRQSPL